jgi:hypothetical protein
MFDKFWNEVHLENINKIIDLDVSGQNVKINGLEAKLCQFLSEGMSIKLYIGDTGAFNGFLIYRVIFDCVMVVRGAYFDKEYRNRGLLRKIVQECCPRVTKVISQSYNHTGLCATDDREIISRDNGLATFITTVREGEDGSI